MRISGGSLRGRQAAVPAGIIRPAMDRMRESVFAILGDLTGQSFLDLFSGSGIIALEAASRGAAPVEAVEQDPLKRKTLLGNVSLAPTRIQCKFMPAERYIKRAKKSFDIVFCDPPFPYRYKQELIQSIVASPLLHDGSALLIHRPKEDQIPKDMPNLKLKRSNQYGRSIVDFFVFSFF
ncbi:MAG: RsmD family RNA methyltransferase [Spirochaetaceae bacterium]|jgi:16S rRNA (guanine(966)-N(2))-methyltransferase RsmD|nr:RsmD family RNA methyltransferase [Spirochaetaceae bacterium]